MLNLPVGRRRAEEFARLLDEGLPRTDAPADGELGRLVALATAIRSSDPAPDPAYVARSRQRLVAMASVMAAVQVPAQRRAGPAPRPTSPVARWFAEWRGQRRMAVASGLVTALVIIVALGIGGARSLPGEPLYGIKRSAEAFELATTSGDVARGRLHLEFAATRLSEVSALAHGRSTAAAALPGHPVAGGLAAGRQTTRLILGGLIAMDNQVIAGSRDLTQAWQATGDPALLTELRGFSRRQFRVLAALVPDLPLGARMTAEQSLALLVVVSRRTEQLAAIGQCGSGCRRSGGPGFVMRVDALGPLPCDARCQRTLAAVGRPGSGTAATRSLIVDPTGSTPAGTAPSATGTGGATLGGVLAGTTAESGSLGGQLLQIVTVLPPTTPSQPVPSASVPLPPLPVPVPSATTGVGPLPSSPVPLPTTSPVPSLPSAPVPSPTAVSPVPVPTVTPPAVTAPSTPPLPSSLTTVLPSPSLPL